MSISRFAFPTDIRFGVGARRLVADHLHERGLCRPLIVTDRALAALPSFAEFRSLLDELQPAVFDGVFGNPTTDQVAAGSGAYAAHGADCVVGFGGGAALDVAKLVALMAVHDGDVLDYAWDHPQPRAISAVLPWLVLLPTTAGTGSEVGRSAVVSETGSGIKRTVFAPQLLAKVVFADPELTVGLPPAVTAATGFDALTHNIESYLSPAWHPMCDGIALEGLRLGARSLALAVAEPANLQARADMLISSMMGAVAFQKDLGSVHACAHALGAVCGMHHGLANALMIEPVLAWNHEAVPARFDELAHAAGLSGGGAALLPWLKDLKQRIGITGGLAAHGVEPQQLDRLVELAAADFCGRTNPRPATAADYRRFFEQAL
ncbi:iron-containing alcohol dehydrogenase [Piscinibacter sakaiensis]|uniref:iron-containing alcohol dehydrogenase n=1 Tax=Piscinibacter sakaiensis TaxID=1547922 RepID=UPI003AB03E6E